MEVTPVYDVGDMVKVNKETLGASAISGKDLAGKVGIILEKWKRIYVPSYWVHFGPGDGCWMDEDDLTIVSSCASV
tara:strand:+ start:179 stop:406 length:228 start_codon:yes stop_codon:yes gene_type:complete